MNSNDFTWVLKSFDKDSRDFGSCLGSRGLGFRIWFPEIGFGILGV